MRTGGIVEMTPAGAPVRSRSADSPGTDPGQRVYSAAIVPSLDRIVTTTTDMHADSPASRNLQVWSLKDLQLLHTFPLPDGPVGNEGLLTAEPRLLDDGKTVLVSTFRCGLYLMEGLEGDGALCAARGLVPAEAGRVLRHPGHRRSLLSRHGAGLERRREPRHQRSGGAARSQPRHARGG